MEFTCMVETKLCRRKVKLLALRRSGGVPQTPMVWLGHVAAKIVNAVLPDVVCSPFCGRQSSEDLVLLCLSLFLEEPY
jgi:hypothetical protein